MEKYKKMFYLTLSLLATALVLMIIVKIFFSMLDWAIRIIGIIMLICIPFVVYYCIKYKEN